MAYPPWNPATNYPVDSIVSYEGVPYQATRYHLSTNTQPPNVEVREIEPLFGQQRGWTVYGGAQPEGSFGGRQAATMTATKRPFDPDDDWTDSVVPNNEFQQGPYFVGESRVEYQGTTNAPSFKCPKADCQVYFTDGFVYDGNVDHFNFTLITNPELVTLGDGRTFYTNGDIEESNTTYVFFFHDAGWAYRRTFEVTFTRADDITVEEVRTFAGAQKYYVRPPFILPVQPFPPFTAWDTPYFRPGNEAFTVNWTLSLSISPLGFKVPNVY
jgi:hypothetical protein